MPILYLIINLSSAAPVLISVPSGVLSECERLEQQVMVSPEVEFDELRVRTEAGIAANPRRGTAAGFFPIRMKFRDPILPSHPVWLRWRPAAGRYRQ